jgi:hypothetical protein
MRDSSFISRTKRKAAVFYIRLSLQKVDLWEAQAKEADKIWFSAALDEEASLSRLSRQSSGGSTNQGAKSCQ